MLTIEEYIARRKKEDNINEFDKKARADNMRICVNYVFEYYNNYLDITPEEEKTILKEEKLDKFRWQLRGFSEEVREWLVEIYSEYGKYLHKHIKNILKENEFFPLYNTDSELRDVSYHCYANLIGKLPFLKNQTEMLFLLIKDYREYLYNNTFWGGDDPSPYICEEVNEWIEKTRAKYDVNLYTFVQEYLDYFSMDSDMWPRTHKIKTNSKYFDYDYKQTSNLFNIDSLYRKMPKKPFTRGRKQEFEMMMMYYWVHNIDGEEEYWQEYLEKTLPSLKKE